MRVGLKAIILLFVMLLMQSGSIQAAPGLEPNAAARQSKSTESPADVPLPVRTEITRFERWLVTCDEFTEPAPKRSCHGDLQITKAETGQSILSWTVFAAQGSDLTAFLRVPTGITIANGIEVLLGDQTAKKFPFLSCEPGQCVGNFALSSSLAKDFSAANIVKVVFFSANGRRIEISQSLKGMDQVYSALHSASIKK